MQNSRVALVLAVVGNGVWGLPLTPVSSDEVLDIREQDKRQDADAAYDAAYGVYEKRQDTDAAYGVYEKRQDADAAYGVYEKR